MPTRRAAAGARAFDAGADDCVTKPLAPRELIARLRAKLDPSHRVRHIVTEHGVGYRFAAP